MLGRGFAGTGAWSRRVGAVMLVAALAGCVDVTADVQVKTPATATARLTETVAAQFYPMIKAARKTGGRTGPMASFCHMGVMTENADGSATCVETHAGAFGELGFASVHGEDIVYAPAGGGRVRVSLSVQGIAAGLTRHATDSMSPDDARARRQMLIAYFNGRTLTFRVGGAAIASTNMKLQPGGTAAAVTVPFDAIIEGSPDVPAQYYAIVVPESAR